MTYCVQLMGDLSGIAVTTVLLTRWRQKSAGTEMERNYITVTLWTKRSSSWILNLQLC